MTYWIWLRRRSGEPTIHRDSLLPGVIPGRVMLMLSVGFADRMGLCAHCGMAGRCHVIGPAGEKYCTVLFHDAALPRWRLEDVA